MVTKTVLRRRLAGKRWPEMTRDEQTAVLDWVVDTCLYGGASLQTAYLVAAQFAHAMEPELVHWWQR